MDELIQKLKGEIIEVLNLEDIEPDDIDEKDSLFNDGLGLDSIDALELIVLLDRNYDLRLEKDEEGIKVFYSVESMAKYITAHKK